MRVLFDEIIIGNKIHFLVCNMLTSIKFSPITIITSSLPVAEGDLIRGNKHNMNKYIEEPTVTKTED